MHIVSVHEPDRAGFYDLEGPLMAFNRNGSIFLNLRFYLGAFPFLPWHQAKS